MRVRVDEAGHDHAAARIDESCAGMCGLQLGSRANSHDQAVLNRDAAVVEKGLAIVMRDQAAIADQQMRRLLPRLLHRAMDSSQTSCLSVVIQITLGLRRIDGQ